MLLLIMTQVVFAVFHKPTFSGLCFRDWITLKTAEFPKASVWKFGVL